MEHARASPDSSADGSNGGYRILSVDDEPTILWTRQHLLESAGYEVLSAGDGEQALRLFEAARPDLVILDCSMPGMDGDDIALQVKNRMPQVPVIMVSALPLENEIPPAVDCFIGKAQSPALLLEQIKRLLPPGRDPAIGL